MSPSEKRHDLQQKATRLLARRAFSRGELRDRLSDSAEQQDLGVVLDRLEELNLLNDLEYAYNFAADRSRRGWGPGKIRAELARRQVPCSFIPDAIESVLSAADEPLVLARYLQHLLAKQNPLADQKKARKLIQHLQRRGFSESAIRRCLEDVATSEFWDLVHKES